MASKQNFEFYNAVAPRYIELLFIQLQYGCWYDMAQLKSILRANGLDIEGSNIVERNTSAWSLAGLGESKNEQKGRSVIRLELHPKNWTQKQRFLVNRRARGLLGGPLVLELDRGQVAQR